MQHYDRAYKRLFAHPEMVVHLLLLIQQDWVEQLDWGTLQRVNTVLVAGPPLERQADMVWRIRLKGGQIDIYIVLEFRTRSLRGRNDRSEKAGNRGQISSILRLIVALFVEKSRGYGPILPLSQ